MSLDLVLQHPWSFQRTRFERRHDGIMCPVEVRDVPRPKAKAATAHSPEAGKQKNMGGPNCQGGPPTWTGWCLVMSALFRCIMVGNNPSLFSLISYEILWDPVALGFHSLKVLKQKQLYLTTNHLLTFWVLGGSSHLVSG